MPDKHAQNVADMPTQTPPPPNPRTRTSTPHRARNSTASWRTAAKKKKKKKGEGVRRETTCIFRAKTNRYGADSTRLVCGRVLRAKAEDNGTVMGANVERALRQARERASTRSTAFKRTRGTETKKVLSEIAFSTNGRTCSYAIYALRRLPPSHPRAQPGGPYCVGRTRTQHCPAGAQTWAGGDGRGGP